MRIVARDRYVGGSLRALRAAALTGSAVLLTGGSAFAQSAWNNSGASNWATGSNWTPNGVPTAATAVTIDNGGEAQVTTTGQTSSTIAVGGAASGHLTITSGGTLSTTAGTATVIGGAGTGTATVTRSGSAWTNAGGLVVGDQSGGKGTLTVDLGATLTTNTTSLTGTIIGNATGSSGSATVDGTGSVWTSDGTITIGTSGTGALTVSAGGKVEDASAAVGSVTGGKGTVDVTGAKSLWQTDGVLILGVAGNGTLTVEAGGKATNTDATLGASTGGSGTAKVTGQGSIWTSTGALTIGATGTGDLTVEAGGSVESKTASVGSNAAGIGTVKITGLGSTWTVDTTAVIGDAGSGDVTIEAAATATSGATTFANAADSSGTAKITGTGSDWTVTGALVVGNAGDGSITIEAAGKLNSDGTTIAALAGSSSGIKVTGAGSQWVDAGAVTIGAKGDGSLEVYVGGKATTGAAILAASAGSIGTAAVTGVGSSWSTTGNLTVGQSGTGSLTIAAGGALSVGGGTGTITLATNAGSKGTLTIGGGATSGTLDAAEIHGGAGTATIALSQSDSFTINALISGTTAIDQTGSGTTILAHTNTYTGTTTVDAGILQAGAENAFGKGSAVSVAAAGTLDLDGFDQTIASLNDQGLVSLAGKTAGTTLTVTGNLVGGGTITLGAKLGNDASLTDELLVGGNVTGSTFLKVANLGGKGAATTGDGIEIITVGGTATADAFTLGRTIAGAWDYDLYQGGLGADAKDGNWYLRSSLSFAAQTYRAYPQTLINYDNETIGTFAERRGEAPDQPGATWVRAGGSWRTETPDDGSSYQQGLGFVQAGYENDLGSGANGAMTAGAIITLGHSETRIATTKPDESGTGTIATTSGGLGASLTWRGKDGLYVDAVGQLTLHDSNISVSDGGDLVSNNLSLGATASLEVGKAITFAHDWTLTPQAQIIVSTVGINGFTDQDSSAVATTMGTEILGRAGLRLAHATDWEDSSGDTERIEAYGIINVSYAFMGRTVVSIEGTDLVQQDRPLRADVGAGADWTLSPFLRLYAQGTYGAALGGDSTRWQATAGLDVRW